MWYTDTLTRAGKETGLRDSSHRLSAATRVHLMWARLSCAVRRTLTHKWQQCHTEAGSLRELPDKGPTTQKLQRMHIALVPASKTSVTLPAMTIKHLRVSEAYLCTQISSVTESVSSG